MELKSGEDEQDDDVQENEQLFARQPATSYSYSARKRMPSVQSFLAWVLLLGVSIFTLKGMARLDATCTVAVQHADVALQSLAGSSAFSTIPLARAHSHNDYLQSQPLTSALGAGFCSIEVDVFLDNGKLLVGHTVASDQTMQELYLEPLKRHIDENGGSVFPRAKPLGICTQVQLVVDIKTENFAETWDAIETALTQELGPDKGNYLSCDLEKRAADEASSLPISPLRVVVSGVDGKKIPNFALHMSNRANRCSSLDGRRDVNKSPAVTRALELVQTMVSEDLAMFTGVNGAVDESRLREFAEYTREKGFASRLWGVNASTELWQLAIDSGIDVISVDRILLFKQFLLG